MIILLKEIHWVSQNLKKKKQNTELLLAFGRDAAPDTVLSNYHI